MKFFKLMSDYNNPNIPVAIIKECYGFEQYHFNTAKKVEEWNTDFSFFYNSNDGKPLTDYLRNDLGCLVVSSRIKSLWDILSTTIQYLPVKVINEATGSINREYYIANVLLEIDALCLDQSKYYSTEIERNGKKETIVVVSKYVLFGTRVANNDIFKLTKGQQIPVFVSEKFVKEMKSANMDIGMDFLEVRIV